jgi:Cellulase (glycosyl hydrolase family 5)
MRGQTGLDEIFCEFPSKAVHANRSRISRTLRAIMVLCAAALACLAGCNGGSSSPPPPPTVNPNPTPSAASLTPSLSLAGAPGFNLTVTGANFLPSSTVQWNGSARPTTFGSSTSLQAAITAADIATAGTAMVSVATPAPGGGTSTALAFAINVPNPVVAVSPVSAIIAAGGQQQFTANVTNALTQAVTWQVNGISGGNAAVGTISNAGLYIAPLAQTGVTITAVSQEDANKLAAASLSVLAPHTIGVRPTATIAEFFDRTTGNAFVPRGNNYIRLAALTFPDGSVQVSHSTFNIGLYDGVGLDSALNQMQTSGYNLVRVFLNGCCNNTIGNPAGGLSSAYLANLADFLKRAKQHGIWVIVEADWVPAFGGYSNNYAGCTNFSNFNTLNLCAGGVQAVTIFFHDIVQGLTNASAPLDAIFAYELRNEYYYDSNSPPLSWTSGTVTTADGQTYDMSNAASRQQMMDNGLIFFTDQVRAAILALDPTALVEVGFFVPQTPNPTRFGDPRVITVYPAMANSTADFVSVHPYPLAGGLTFAQYVQNFGFVGYQQQKPVVLEEFGVLESDYPVETTAANVAQNWQVQSCAYGIKGWSFWTWDTSTAEQVPPPFWPAALSAGFIAQALSPAVRPDPCH